MTNLTSIGVTSGIGSSGTGTVSTIDAMFTAAGSPSATNVQTVQQSTNVFTVAVSSVTGGTITSVGTVTTVTTVTTVGSLSSGTLASLSSGTVAIGNAGTIAAVKAAQTAASSNDTALVVALSPNNPVTTSQAATTTFTVVASAGTNATLIQAVPTTFYGGHFYNNATTPRYVKVYNSSVAPTAGSSLELFTIGVAPGATRDVLLAGTTSSRGIGYTITAGITSTDTTAVSADDIHGMIEYR